MTANTVAAAPLRTPNKEHRLPKAKICGIPTEHEIGDEIPVRGSEDHYAHPILSSAMQPALRRGEMYIFDHTSIPNDRPKDGTVVAAYVHIRRGKEIMVVRRFFHDEKTGQVTLKAENAATPPIMGKLTPEGREIQAGEIWPFAILHDQRSIREIQLPEIEAEEAEESEYFTLEVMDGIDHGKPSNSNIFCSRPLSHSRPHLPGSDVTASKPAKLDDPREGKQLKGKFSAAVPLNDAMSPLFPSGEYIIFSDLEMGNHSIVPGDIVYACLFVTGRDRLVKRAFVTVRRYGVNEKGKITLSPLQDGFSTWTEGQRFEDGKIAISVCAVATQYKALLHNSKEVLFYLPKSDDVKEAA